VPPDEGDGAEGDGAEGGDSAAGETGDAGQPEEGGVILDPPPGGSRHVKYVVNDVPVWVVAERVQYYGKDGKLITESLKDCTRKAVPDEYASLDDFLTSWNAAEQKKAIIDELESQGVLLDALAEEVGKQLDPFDLICHVAYGQPPLTRRQRAENVRKRDYFARDGRLTTGVHTVRLKLTGLPEMHPCLLWNDILAAAVAVVEQDTASRSYPVFLQIQEIPGYGSGEVQLEITVAGVPRGDVAKARRTYASHRLVELAAIAVAGSAPRPVSGAPAILTGRWRCSTT